MAREKPTDLIARQEAIRDRAAWLLTQVFEGRLRRMARSMGVAHPVLSRVVRGLQGAGPDFVAALAALPGVSPRWVHEGLGEPLLPPIRGTLPVAHCVLPGWPERYPGMLTGLRHPVAEALERPSRYWYSVPANCSLASAPGLALLPGDLLLLDADPAAWEANLAGLAGQLFVVRLRRGPLESFVLGQLAAHVEGLLIDMVGEVVRLSLDGAGASCSSRAQAAEAVPAESSPALSDRRPRRRAHPLPRSLQDKLAEEPGRLHAGPGPKEARPGAPAKPAPARAAANAPASGRADSAPLGCTVGDLVAVRVYTVRP